MASVELEFIAPDIEDLARVFVYESPFVGGPFVRIDTIEEIGVWPDYIDHLSTGNANNVNNFFTIQWETVGGVQTDMSAPIQGGTDTLAGSIIEQIRLRQPGIPGNVMLLEAKASIEFATSLDPDTASRTDVSYNQLSGLVLLTHARSLIATSGASSGTQWQAGIVSMKNDIAADKQKQIEAMLKLASDKLGLSYSVILQLAETPVAGGMKQLVAVDLSRSIFEIQ